MKHWKIYIIAITPILIVGIMSDLLGWPAHYLNITGSLVLITVTIGLARHLFESCHPKKQDKESEAFYHNEAWKKIRETVMQDFEFKIGDRVQVRNDSASGYQWFEGTVSDISHKGAIVEVRFADEFEVWFNYFDLKLLSSKSKNGSMSSTPPPKYTIPAPPKPTFKNGDEVSVKIGDYYGHAKRGSRGTVVMVDGPHQSDVLVDFKYIPDTPVEYRKFWMRACDLELAKSKQAKKLDCETIRRESEVERVVRLTSTTFEANARALLANLQSLHSNTKRLKTERELKVGDEVMTIKDRSPLGVPAEYHGTIVEIVGDFKEKRALVRYDRKRNGVGEGCFKWWAWYEDLKLIEKPEPIELKQRFGMTFVDKDNNDILTVKQSRYREDHLFFNTHLSHSCYLSPDQIRELATSMEEFLEAIEY